MAGEGKEFDARSEPNGKDARGGNPEIGAEGMAGGAFLGDLAEDGVFFGSPGRSGVVGF